MLRSSLSEIPATIVESKDDSLLRSVTSMQLLIENDVAIEITTFPECFLELYC